MNVAVLIRHGRFGLEEVRAYSDPDMATTVAQEMARDYAGETGTVDETNPHQDDGMIYRGEYDPEGQFVAVITRELL